MTKLEDAKASVTTHLCSILVLTLLICRSLRKRFSIALQPGTPSN